MNQLLDEPLAAQAAQTPEEETAPPALWWIRDGVPDAQLHKVDPQREGKTLCRLTLHAGRFRPASSTEVRTRRRCPLCSPPESRSKH